MILNRKSAKTKGLAQTLMSLSVQFIHLDVSFMFIFDRQQHIWQPTGWTPASALQRKTLLSSLTARGKNTGKRPPGWKWLGKITRSVSARSRRNFVNVGILIANIKR